MGFIEDYDNETFWDELAERLAFRDLMGQEGAEKVRAMEPEEWLERIGSLREKYMAVADIELEAIVRQKNVLDTAGHYARPDILRLLIDRSPRAVVEEVEPELEEECGEGEKME